MQGVALHFTFHMYNFLHILCLNFYPMNCFKQPKNSKVKKQEIYNGGLGEKGRGEISLHNHLIPALLNKYHFQL